MNVARVWPSCGEINLRKCNQCSRLFLTSRLTWRIIAVKIEEVMVWKAILLLLSAAAGAMEMLFESYAVKDHKHLQLSQMQLFWRFWEGPRRSGIWKFFLWPELFFSGPKTNHISKGMVALKIILMVSDKQGLPGQTFWDKDQGQDQFQLGQ